MNDLSRSKVVCIGRNYIKHIHELNNDIPDSPVIFIKPNSAITNRLDIDIKENIHYEIELVLLYGPKQRVKAIGVGLDLTKRDLQTKLKNKSLPWELSKSFDNSAVISEFLDIGNFDINKLYFYGYKNNSLVQKGLCNHMIFKPSYIVEFLNKHSIEMKDNDILMTGTPEGVGKIDFGDDFYIELFYDNKLILKTKFDFKS